MNRWVVRIFGLILIVALLILLSNLQSRLTEMQQQKNGAATATRP